MNVLECEAAPHPQIVVLETLHLAGVVLLLFRVLPYFGSLFALSLLYAVCVVPSICKLFLSKPAPNKSSSGTCRLPIVSSNSHPEVLLDVVV